MKKLKLTNILGIIGAVIWTLTVLGRDTNLMTNESIKFILGIAPNIGAPWIFAFISESLYTSFYKNEYTYKLTIITLVGISVLAITSEIIHDFFLGSPFDIYDIIATLISVIIYAAV
ncbi:hypothetical protein [Clostridium sp. LP20]|uniref:hypothetical protein n=1 Tax=Clostridium sp. LP20 TaxID=3418665 RepID=UPI003EE6CB5B